MKKRIKLLALFFLLAVLTGCPLGDKTYVTAEEQYVIGWLLHNIDEDTPTTLDYSEEDFAVYNYSGSVNLNSQFLENSDTIEKSQCPRQ